MKPGWMRFWRSGSTALLTCLVGSALASRAANQSSRAPHPPSELTLAVLQPGKDSLPRAKSRFGKPQAAQPGDNSFSWPDYCGKRLLSVDIEPSGKIRSVRVKFVAWPNDCVKASPLEWKTGRGLAIYDSTARVIQLYGQPDTRSPFPESWQQLELFRYAFDGAGPAVPHLLEVLCTQEKDGVPGHVVEITLAAASR